MKYQTQRRIFVIGASVAVTLLVASCAITPNVDGPTFAGAGSSWTNQLRNSGSFGNGTTQATARSLGEQTWQGRKVRAIELPQGIRLSDATTGAWLAVVKDGQTLNTWEPSLGYDWPLTVGKSFAKDFRFVNHVTNQAFDIRSTMTVESYETVTVAAGTFKAFKVRYTDAATEILSWYSPDVGGWVKNQTKRNGSHPAGPGTQETELLSYSLKK